MGRFLLRFSYVGARYGGVQIQKKCGRNQKTVQGQIAAVLRNVMRRHLEDPNKNLISLVSSRTDAGVHALCNAMIVEFPERRIKGELHNLPQLQQIMNKYLYELGEEIRILNIQQVPDFFNCIKTPFRRKYLYRLGIIRDRSYTNIDIPSVDTEFTHIVYPPFDMDKFLQAAEVMSGTNNFLSFTSLKALEQRSPVKTVNINVRRSAPFIGDLNVELQEQVDFWEIHISSKSYMYKQIRRMVHGMYAIASGKCSIDDLQQTLKDPSHKVKSFQYSFPAHGLFLNKVEYHPESLAYLGPSDKLKKEYRKLSTILDKYLDICGYKQELTDLDSHMTENLCSQTNGEQPESPVGGSSLENEHIHRKNIGNGTLDNADILDNKELLQMKAKG